MRELAPEGIIHSAGLHLLVNQMTNMITAVVAEVLACRSSNWCLRHAERKSVRHPRCRSPSHRLVNVDHTGPPRQRKRGSVARASGDQRVSWPGKPAEPIAGPSADPAPALCTSGSARADAATSSLLTFVPGVAQRSPRRPGKWHLRGVAQLR